MRPRAAIDTTPYWTAGDVGPTYPALARNLTVDVVVVGAGMTGVTTAYLPEGRGADGRRASPSLASNARCWNCSPRPTSPTAGPAR